MRLPERSDINPLPSKLGLIAVRKWFDTESIQIQEMAHAMHGVSQGANWDNVLQKCDVMWVSWPKNRQTSKTKINAGYDGHYILNYLLILWNYSVLVLCSLSSFEFCDFYTLAINFFIYSQWIKDFFELIFCHATSHMLNGQWVFLPFSHWFNCVIPTALSQ